MIPQQNLELSQTRDFSQIIGDTFQFIRENFKQLITCFFVFCGFFLVATFITVFLYQLNLVSLTNNISNDPDSYDSASPAGILSKVFNAEFVLIILFEFFYIIMVHVCIISYIALYKAKGNQPVTTAEVWGYVKYYFFRVMGSSMVLYLLALFAFLCCVIPGIWIYPAVSLMIPIMIIENGSLGYAFNQAFKLIKGNWWMTFGVIFVTGIVAAILSSIVTVPSSLLAFGTMFLHKTAHAGGSQLFTAIYYVCAELARVFYIIPTIAIVITYFSLNEAQEGTGLMERINQMGNDSPTDLPAEEY